LKQWLFEAKLSLGTAVNVTPARRSDTAEAKNTLLSIRLLPCVKTWLTPRNKLALSSAVNQLRRRFSNFTNVVAFRLLQSRLAAEGFQGAGAH
jgi:hypothetical protein